MKKYLHSKLKVLTTNINSHSDTSQVSTASAASSASQSSSSLLRYMKLLGFIMLLFISVMLAGSASVSASAAVPKLRMYLGQKTNAEMYKFDSLKLTTTLNGTADGKAGSDVTYTDVKWYSNNKSVATVSKNGVVYARKAGKVTITVKAVAKTHKTYTIRRKTKSGKKKKITKVKTVKYNVVARTAIKVSNLISHAGIYVDGYEYGAAVPKVIFKVNGDITDINADGMEYSYWRENETVATRQITDVYLSDSQGNRLDTSSASASSRYFTVELKTGAGNQASPFTMEDDNEKDYVAHYYVSLDGGTITVNGSQEEISYYGDALPHRVTSSDSFKKVDNAQVTGMNYQTGQTETQALGYAAYEPQSLAGGEKNPLIIWLRGGSGGTRIESALYVGNVLALTKSQIQSHFTSGSQTGAYVLYVQAPGYWTDDGNGKKNPRSVQSRYTIGLKNLIDQYVAENGDIDASRIYICGFSQGGYMTVNMMLNYPDYFAAGIAVSCIYPYYTENTKGQPTGEIYFTQDKAETLAQQNIWFVQSGNDAKANPVTYSLPLYQALLKAGAQNAWYSFFETVVGADGVTSYSGHNSSTYVYNDMVGGVQDIDSILHYGISAALANNYSRGGMSTAEYNGVKYPNMFDWLNAQTR